MSRDSFFRIIPETFPPIFSGMFDDLTLFYAPGYLVAAREKEAAEIRNIIIGEFPFGNLPAGELINAAISAQSGWSIQHDPYCYHPTCLTIYSAAACNLNCIYCFAEKVHAQKMQLSGDLIFSAAEKVLRNCKELQVPFTVVFHGGGEPMQDFNLPGLLLNLNRMADGAQVIFHSYIATNGVMDADRANWMAANFDEIGLSVDGPPEIQNLQRPGKTGVETAAAVERTAGILKKIKGSLSVRATVLPDNFKRIPEIVSYLKNNLDADEIAATRLGMNASAWNELSGRSTDAIARYSDR